MQVVRYHSLVIDPSSLPKDLIPIAWTSSYETIPFLGSQNLDSRVDGFEREGGPENFAKSLSIKSESGLQWHSSDSPELQSRNILMGIMHSSRPHYGLQVNIHPDHTLFGFNFIYSKINSFCFFGSSFIRRALLLAMGSKYSKILPKSQRTTGLS